MPHRTILASEPDVSPGCTRDGVAPLVSAAAKMLAMSRVLENYLSDFLSLSMGSLFGAINYVIQYNYITQSIHNPGIHLVSMSDEEIQTISGTEEGKAFLVLIASLSSGFVDAVKAFLKTSELDPRISLAFAFQTFLTSQASHMQAMGQKWLGESGVNINDTWAGQIAKLFMLDFDFLNKYFFDLRSLIIKLYPAFEAALQGAVIFNVGELTGFNNPNYLVPLAMYTSYGPYLLHKGYGQEIMANSLALESREHTFLSYLIDRLVDMLEVIVDTAITLPCDLLSVIISPDYIVMSSNRVAGASREGLFFARAITQLPKSLASYAQGISQTQAGCFGGSIGMLVQGSHESAAWQQELTITQKSKTTKKYIGVKPILDRKFEDEYMSDDEPGSSPSCGSRLMNYLSYRAGSCTNFLNLFRCRKHSNDYDDLDTKEMDESDDDLNTNGMNNAPCRTYQSNA